MKLDSQRYCMVICSCPNDAHADMLSRSLIESRLAACVQIMPIRSFYEWKGEICKEEECLLLIKTKSSLYNSIEDLISRNHPYEVPEILMVPATGGLEKYLNWIETVCG
jgi:periplasmic divalent cation tolerance protein